MRHLWSFLAGLVAAPLSWALIALGQDGSATTITRWTEAGSYNVANLIEPTVYLAVAGILLGLLGTLRFSPLGPVTAGLLLAGSYVAMYVDPFEVRDRVPSNREVLGDPLPLRLPLENGTLFMIGLLLLMAAFSVQRWRRWPRTAAKKAAPTSDSSDSNGSGTEPDTASVSLGYPEPQATPATGREAGSPWSDPPRSASGRDKLP